MSHKLFHRIMPPLLAALIAAAGFLVPLEMLTWREKQIKAGNGAVDAKSLSILTYSAASAKQKILQLSDFVVDLFHGNDGLVSESIKVRTPLDTELSYDDAVDSALYFLETFFEHMEEQYALPFHYGGYAPYTYEDDLRESETVVGNAEDSTSGTVDAVFFASADDASLSFWVVMQSGFLMALDGVSGTPLYTSLSLSFDPSLAYAGDEYEEFGEVISLAAGATYNDIYAFSFSDLSMGDHDSGWPSQEFEQITSDGYKLLSATTVEAVYAEEGTCAYEEGACAYCVEFWLSE